MIETTRNNYRWSGVTLDPTKTQLSLPRKLLISSVKYIRLQVVRPPRHKVSLVNGAPSTIPRNLVQLQMALYTLRGCRNHSARLV